MQIVVTGGAASGKSAHAERILCKYSQKNSRLYVATMQPFGKSAKARILRHHALRAGKGFETAERYTNLSRYHAARQYEGILLECMSNLLANELFSPDGAGEQAVAEIMEGVNTLKAQCNTLVIVTNEIFSDGDIYSPETMQYMRMLGDLNQALFASSDAAAESVCGILIPHKGKHLL